MNRRNWLQLSRKLVDRFDFDYTVNAISSALNMAMQSILGEGVYPTAIYPTPFPITMSGSVLGGTVGNGQAIDPNGQLVEITSASPTSKAFTLATSDPTNPRWDLLVLQYVATGDTLIPEPSDPITSIDLNFHDDFALAVVTGTPSGSPAYPSKGVNDVILAGMKVPANATLGTSVAVDLTIREMANLFAFTNLRLVSEEVGQGEGSAVAFTVTGTPQGVNVVVLVDGVVQRSNQFSYNSTTQVITLNVAPDIGQDVEALYISR